MLYATARGLDAFDQRLAAGRGGSLCCAQLLQAAQAQAADIAFAERAPQRVVEPGGGARTRRVVVHGAAEDAAAAGIVFSNAPRKPDAELGWQSMPGRGQPGWPGSGG